MIMHFLNQHHILGNFDGKENAEYHILYEQYEHKVGTKFWHFFISLYSKPYNYIILKVYMLPYS